MCKQRTGAEELWANIDAGSLEQGKRRWVGARDSGFGYWSTERRKREMTRIGLEKAKGKRKQAARRRSQLVSARRSKGENKMEKKWNDSAIGKERHGSSSRIFFSLTCCARIQISSLTMSNVSPLSLAAFQKKTRQMNVDGESRHRLWLHVLSTDPNCIYARFHIIKALSLFARRGWSPLEELHQDIRTICAITVAIELALFISLASNPRPSLCVSSLLGEEKSTDDVASPCCPSLFLSNSRTG